MSDCLFLVNGRRDGLQVVKNIKNGRTVSNSKIKQREKVNKSILFRFNAVRQAYSNKYLVQHQIVYKYNQTICLMNTMFYFVFPGTLPINPYPWMQPISQTLTNTQPQSQLQKRTQKRQSIVQNIILSSMPIQHASATQSQSNPLNSKKIVNSKRSQVDDDYRPVSSGNKKIKKSKQMQNRNIIPNIIRLILSYTLKKEKSLKTVQLLLKKYSNGTSSICAKRYYLYQKMVRGKINNYVNEQTLKELYKMRPQEYQVYPEDEQRVYNRITRILISQFIREDIVSCILTSKRMQSSKKKNHIEAVRIIKQKILDLLQC